MFHQKQSFDFYRQSVVENLVSCKQFIDQRLLIYLEVERTIRRFEGKEIAEFIF